MFVGRPVGQVCGLPLVVSMYRGNAASAKTVTSAGFATVAAQALASGTSGAASPLSVNSFSSGLSASPAAKAAASISHYVNESIVEQMVRQFVAFTIVATHAKIILQLAAMSALSSFGDGMTDL